MRRTPLRLLSEGVDDLAKLERALASGRMNLTMSNLHRFAQKSLRYGREGELLVKKVVERLMDEHRRSYDKYLAGSALGWMSNAFLQRSGAYYNTVKQELPDSFRALRKQIKERALRGKDFLSYIQVLLDSDPTGFSTEILLDYAKFLRKLVTGLEELYGALRR